MDDVQELPAHPDLKPANTIVIDADFIRTQAAEALATFFAPFHGVVIAATGPRRRGRTRRTKPTA